MLTDVPPQNTSQIKTASFDLCVQGWGPAWDRGWPSGLFTLTAPKAPEFPGASEFLRQRTMGPGLHNLLLVDWQEMREIPRLAPRASLSRASGTYVPFGSGKMDLNAACGETRDNYVLKQ